jgi:hypothetical protein
MVITAPTVIAHIAGIPVEELALLAPYGATLAVVARVVIARANRRQRQTRDPRTQ